MPYGKSSGNVESKKKIDETFWNEVKKTFWILYEKLKKRSIKYIAKTDYH